MPEQPRIIRWDFRFSSNRPSRRVDLFSWVTFFSAAVAGFRGLLDVRYKAEAERSKNRPPALSRRGALDMGGIRVEGTHPHTFFRCKSATWHGEVGRAVACIRYGSKGPRARVVAWTAG